MNLNRNATLAEVGEFPLIAAITQGLSLAPDVSVGPGDAAAVLMIKDAVATSVDVLVEGSFPARLVRGSRCRTEGSRCQRRRHRGDRCAGHWSVGGFFGST